MHVLLAELQAKIEARKALVKSQLLGLHSGNLYQARDLSGQETAYDIVLAEIANLDRAKQ
jgi:hypothetical protein